jgi:hypothetical protein
VVQTIVCAIFFRRIENYAKVTRVMQKCITFFNGCFIFKAIGVGTVLALVIKKED